MALFLSSYVTLGHEKTAPPLCQLKKDIQPVEGISVKFCKWTIDYKLLKNILSSTTNSKLIEILSW
jgi:hypothetical protein